MVESVKMVRELVGDKKSNSTGQSHTLYTMKKA
jgi:hypothetical protein